ncbi:cytidine deaminase [Aliidiomarina maris]|uniref:Cytidine deaminase n=1 Tax=Aliidiomarina maris TaxID=531312 RepID=A0A327X2F6_9GAMM|nr:cytidine deaminase [Aliidiomarina maris]RAJ99073.1 cytidine deaminase [Aliidiomarina maris]
MPKQASNSAIHEPCLAAARAAMQQSYSPYSGFKVGAVIVSDQGQTFSACNVENASYPEGTCAEAGAIAAMVMAGQRRIRDIYVMGTGEGLVTPCGGCRQRIREFADADTMVHICNPEQVRKSMRLEELLPFSFGPEHLDTPPATQQG